MRHLLKSVALIAGITGAVSPAAAKILKFEITRVDSPAFEGRSFGASAPMTGSSRARPSRSRRTIPTIRSSSISTARRTTRRASSSVADVEILRPTVAANGNRRLLYEVVNRGSKLGLALFNDNPAVVNDPVKASDAGNGFLMNRGYTMVWSGWQGDVAPGGGRMTFSPPIVPT